MKGERAARARPRIGRREMFVHREPLWPPGCPGVLWAGFRSQEEGMGGPCQPRRHPPKGSIFAAGGSPAAWPGASGNLHLVNAMPRRGGRNPPAVRPHGVLVLDLLHRRPGVAVHARSRIGSGGFAASFRDQGRRVSGAKHSTQARWWEAAGVRGGHCAARPGRCASRPLSHLPPALGSGRRRARWRCRAAGWSSARLPAPSPIAELPRTTKPSGAPTGLSPHCLDSYHAAR